jgi:hypothetical protein
MASDNLFQKSTEFDLQQACFQQGMVLSPTVLDSSDAGCWIERSGRPEENETDPISKIKYQTSMRSTSLRRRLRPDNAIRHRPTALKKGALRPPETIM